MPRDRVPIAPLVLAVPLAAGALGLGFGIGRASERALTIAAIGGAAYVAMKVAK